MRFLKNWERSLLCVAASTDWQPQLPLQLPLAESIEGRVLRRDRPKKPLFGLLGARIHEPRTRLGRFQFLMVTY
jgi:hypothetical protein